MPLNGMLTEEHPAIEIKSDTLTQVFYSDNPYSLPVENGIQYKNRFIPEKSGTYYIQGRFLTRTSEIVEYNFTTYSDSIEKLGIQIGDTESVSLNYMQSNVSMEKAESIDNLPEGVISGWGDNNGGRSSYTIEDINKGKLYDQIILNTISDSIIGSEKNYVGAKEDVTHSEKDFWYADLINVEIEKNIGSASLAIIIVLKVMSELQKM